jgi:hypothetical protein
MRRWKRWNTEKEEYIKNFLEVPKESSKLMRQMPD